MKRSGERELRPTRSGRLAQSAVAERIEITGTLGSHALEAVQLEIRRLAQQCGLDVRGIEIETREPKGQLG